MNAIAPEQINLLDLPSLPLEGRKALPDCAGIYFAIDGNDVVQYIGRSNNIRLRWVRHHKSQQLTKINAVRLAWLEVSDNSLLVSIEEALIKWFDPPLNSTGKRIVDSKLPSSFEEETVKSGMDMSIIHERMRELGIDLAALNRRYCQIRQIKGDEKATPVNRRNMLQKALSENGNPTLETFLDIVEALDGEILIQWKDTKVRKFGESKHLEDKAS